MCSSRVARSAAVTTTAQAALALPMLCFPAVLFAGAMVPVPVMATAGQAIAAETDDILRRTRPDVLGGIVAWPGDGTFIQTVYFTSEAEARANEKREPATDEEREAWERMGSLMLGFSVPVFARRRQFPMRTEAAAMSRMAEADLSDMRAQVDARKVTRGLD